MRILRSISLVRVGHATVTWGVLFAVIHAYWAAGGAAGMGGEPADTAGVQAYIAFIALLGLGGAAVAHRVVRDRRRALVLLARAGGVALLLGVVFGTGRWLADGGLGDDGAAGAVITAYFLLGGLLFAALGWPQAVSSGQRPCSS
ncbi:MAG TPA: hypothetical protein VNO82_24445 [Solirubrobacteraceae bacterium]|nr:hypothetical protein [Solirubrobacteraceae bacterium]